MMTRAFHVQDAIVKFVERNGPAAIEEIDAFLSINFGKVEQTIRQRGLERALDRDLVEDEHGLYHLKTENEVDEPGAVEDNTNAVIAIQLTRIYDVLMVLLSTNDPDAARKLTELHENGEFLSSPPAIVVPDGPTVPDEGEEE